MRKKRGALVAASLAFLFVAYLLFGFETIGTELVVRPAWLATEATIAGFPKAQGKASAVGLKSGGMVAYFTEEGEVAGMAESGDRVVLSDERYATYEEDGSLTSVRSPDGAEEFAIRERGYPFFAAGRLFLARPGMTGISEYSMAGNRLFAYDAPCVITCMDANADVIVLGTLDGEVIVVGPDGATRFAVMPGGSRLAVTVGVAVSRDGMTVAARCGLDRQRIVVYRRSGAEYRAVWHRYVDDEFRQRSVITISDDSRWVFYETRTGFGVVDAETWTEHSLDLSGNGRFVHVDAARGLAIAASRQFGSTRFSVYALPDLLVASFSFPGEEAMIRAGSECVYVGSDAGMARLDFTEK